MPIDRESVKEEWRERERETRDVTGTCKIVRFTSRGDSTEDEEHREEGKKVEKETRQAAGRR